MNRTAGETAVAAVNAFGVRVLVKLEAPGDAPEGLAHQLMDRLLAPWSDSPSPAKTDDKLQVVNLGIVFEDDFERVHSTLSNQVTLSALKSNAGKALMFHAGGIAREDGHVAIIVGPSGSGKTTTLCQLGRHYGYVSDETIAIMSDGALLPYRKPLSIISRGHDHKLQVSPSQLGLLPLPEASLKLGGIAILTRASGAGAKSTVTPMEFSSGLIAVIEQSSYLSELDQPLTRIAEIADEAGGFKILTAGAPEFLHEIGDELFVRGENALWKRAMPAVSELRSNSAAYVPADVLDAVECEDGTVVFTNERQAIKLEGIGPQLWRSACDGDSWEQLIQHIETCFGPAPNGDSRTTIDHSAAALVEAGVLRVGTPTHSVNC